MQPHHTEPPPRNRRSRWLALGLSLVALAGVAIWLRGLDRVSTPSDRSMAMNELGQLASAVQIFQRDKKVNYLPSRIILREKMDYDLKKPLEVDSLLYLKQVWPHLRQKAGSPAFPAGKEVVNGIDWNGNGEIDGDGVTSPPVLLKGDQCLVFFLGGIAPSSETGGFSKNPANPADLPRPSTNYEFNRSRLKDVHANGFASFIDMWGEKPYAYFSNNGKKNGYSASDCRTITGPVFVPYRQESGDYFQPTGFQIVCAGPDKRFGHGGILKAGSFTERSEDGDNFTNFSNGRLSFFEQ